MRMLAPSFFRRAMWGCRRKGIQGFHGLLPCRADHSDQRLTSEEQQGEASMGNLPWKLWQPDVVAFRYAWLQASGCESPLSGFSVRIEFLILVC